MRAQQIGTCIAAFLALNLIAVGSAAATGDEYATIRERLEVCAVCHGINGASSQPEFPILAGQHLYYLYVQMKDFKSERRASPVMQPIIEDFSKEEMLLIAKFYSEQPWPNIGYRANSSRAQVGAVATVAGQCV